ncbi:protein-tyrosine phosphatase family protein [Hyalangium sp.]|uniref:protein-tyrosine phosphatase family protein n=1 Tax=Hyalangium sp. TaxID=2028555 RepID=UPI002D3BA454|nr:tyrosine-protein phosphatase [Hyalangium sp.]HYH96406.1 tyrosine-protein phosphatase [Hyalangium sp.]
MLTRLESGTSSAYPRSRRDWHRPRGRPRARGAEAHSRARQGAPVRCRLPLEGQGQGELCLHTLHGRGTGPANGSGGTRQQPSYPAGPRDAPRKRPPLLPICKAAGIGWIWVPFPGAAVPDSARTDELRQVFRDLRELIAAGSKLVVHCSAGIHRTGMFGYALLRQLGLSADAAHTKLAELRQHTAEGVGPDRLSWGDALVESEHDPQA